MRGVLASLLGILLVSHSAFATLDEKAMNEAVALRERGEFEKATRMLQSYQEQSSTTLSAQERSSVEFEIERMRRIRLDYQLTRQKFLEELKGRVSDFREEEFDRYEREGKLDAQLIDGQKFYVNSSVSNLLLRAPELVKRQSSGKKQTAYRKLYAHMLHAKEAQKLSKSPLLLPQDYAVTFTLHVKENAVAEGKTIRCWLPYVRNFPFQSDAYILTSEPAEHVVAPSESPHRTLYLERKAAKDSPTTFSAQFVYRCWTRVNQVDPALVQSASKQANEVDFYRAERKPHLDLGNEELKRLNGEIVDGETNPYLIARRIYDWIGHNLIYQYAREYSTLDNISYYCASRKAGDCGQHAMLFIALCRMNGIPARWQSGWESYAAKGANMHDWCEFYVEPYGWLPADPDMSVNLLHYASQDLDTTQVQELSDWYFGNMDHFRLATNSDFGMPLFPPKNAFRSETVDFQRGEVEVENQNLYFDQWSYDMEIRPISSSQAAELTRGFIPTVRELPPAPPTPVDDTKPTSAPAAATSETSTTAPAADSQGSTSTQNLAKSEPPTTQTLSASTPAPGQPSAPPAQATSAPQAQPSAPMTSSSETLTTTTK